MAALTWREVSAPDFRNSMAGVENFSRNLAGAFDSARAGLTEVDNSINDRVNKAFAMELLKYQDPAAYEQALASGRVFQGFDRNRLSGESLAAAGARTGSLYAQANSKLGLEQNNYKFNQTKAEDSKAPLIMQAVALAEQGDKEGLTKFRDANPDLFSGFSLQGATDAQAKIFSGLTNFWNRATAEQGYNQSGTRFNWETNDRAAADEADKALAQIDRDAFDKGDALRILRGMNLGSKAYGLVLNRLDGMNWDSGSGFAGNGFAGGGTGSSDFSLGAPQRAVADTLKNSGFSAPVVAGLLGNFHVEGGYSGAKGDGGSAAGIAQWRDDRRQNFVKMFGVDPSKATPAQQAQFVKWEFDNPGKAGMTVKQRDAILNAKDPAEAAHLIDKFYERSSGQHRDRRMNAATAAYSSMGEIFGELASANRDMQRNPNNLPSMYIQAARDRTSSVDDVAAQLDAKHPGLKGMGAGFIKMKLEEIISDAAAKGKSINAATAGVIASNSTNSNAWTRNAPTWLVGGNTGGFYFDDEKASKLIEEYSNENVERAVVANDREGRLDAAHAAAVGQATAAWGRYNRAKYLNENEGKNIDLRPLLEAAQAADQAAAGSQADRVNRGGFSDRGAPPALKPASAAAQPQARRPVAQRPATDAFAKAANGNYADTSSAGSRARAGKVVSAVPSKIGSFIANYNPASLILRSILE